MKQSYRCSQAPSVGGASGMTVHYTPNTEFDDSDKAGNDDNDDDCPVMMIH